jgi:prepilin-type N-terminal cleavage/methylation domain-containing protein
MQNDECRMQNEERKIRGFPSSFCILHSSFCISSLDILNTTPVTDAKELSVNRSRLRAFTLIELMVVIGLIAILGSLLLMGVNHMIIGGKRQATQLAFQNCQAMFSEYDRIARRHFPAWNDPNSFGLNQQLANVEEQSPGDVSLTGSDRQGAAVFMTRDMMGLLRNSPVNAAAMGKLSPKAYMSLPSVPSFPVAAWVSQQYMVAFGRVYTQDQYGNNYYFTCIAIPQVNGVQAAQPQPPSDAYWLAATEDATVPVMLDGWGNPIIFVPSGALTNVTAGGNVGTFKSPDGRPFWASAGPDGIMSQGDDNMYSFEK